jgi:hypothetical protein
MCAKFSLVGINALSDAYGRRIMLSDNSAGGRMHCSKYDSSVGVWISAGLPCRVIPMRLTTEILTPVCIQPCGTGELFAFLGCNTVQIGS